VYTALSGNGDAASNLKQAEQKIQALKTGATW
jgi:hypothetical protein